MNQVSVTGPPGELGAGVIELPPQLAKTEAANATVRILVAVIVACHATLTQVVVHADRIAAGREVRRSGADLVGLIFTSSTTPLSRAEEKLP